MMQSRKQGVSHPDIEKLKVIFNYILGWEKRAVSKLVLVIHT